MVLTPTSYQIILPLFRADDKVDSVHIIEQAVDLRALAAANSLVEEYGRMD